jgi:hypothetical protein
METSGAEHEQELEDNPPTLRKSVEAVNSVAENCLKKVDPEIRSDYITLETWKLIHEKK